MKVIFQVKSIIRNIQLVHFSLRDMIFFMSICFRNNFVSLNKSTNLQICSLVFFPFFLHCFSLSFVFFPYSYIDFFFFSRLSPSYHNTTCFEAMVKQVNFRPVGREGKRAYVLPRSLSRTTDPSLVTASPFSACFLTVISFSFYYSCSIEGQNISFSQCEALCE